MPPKAKEAKASPKPPPKSKAKAKATAKAKGGKAASASVDPTQAQLRALYAEGAEIILTYLNGDSPTSSWYKKLVLRAKKKTLQARARDWCFDHKPERVVEKGKKSIPVFLRQFPLHEHPGTVHEVKTSAGPHRESMDLDPNEADNPWLLFHPDLFNPERNPPYYRFSMERAITARVMQDHENSDELEFRDYTQFIARAPTARSLQGDQFEYALRVVEQMADDEDAERAEDLKQNEKFKKQQADKKKKKQAARKVVKDEEEDDVDNEDDDEELPVQMTAVTARDVLLDRVLIRYMPEFMVWLGHGLKACAGVAIKDSQTRLYKNISMMNSINLMHMRVECIRYVQLLRGDIPAEPNATQIDVFNYLKSPEYTKKLEEERQKKNKDEEQQEQQEENKGEEAQAEEVVSEEE
ncbi:hypothetical protein PG995_012719 [Apiospora arundinis]